MPELKTQFTHEKIHWIFGAAENSSFPLALSGFAKPTKTKNQLNSYALVA